MTSDRPPPGPAAIRLEGVSKWFGRGEHLVHALSRIDLVVGEGEFVSLIGPSGCGKSTMLRLVGGLIEPDRGTISIKGGSPAAARKNKNYAFVPQQPALLPWRSVRRNVSMLGEVHRRANPGLSSGDQLDLIERVGLGPFVDSFPSELSGGMQQRVSIARAFALGAPVMLMDEPFSALDEITRADMRYLLLDLWERTASTVLFVTHSLSEAVVLSDRVVVLGAGPGHVSRVVDIPLARPRHDDIEDTEEYHRLVRDVRAGLRDGSSRR